MGRGGGKDWGGRGRIAPSLPPLAADLDGVEDEAVHDRRCSDEAEVE